MLQKFNELRHFFYKNTPTQILIYCTLALLPFIYWDALRDVSALPRYASLCIAAGLGLILWALESLAGTSRQAKQLALPHWYIALLALYLYSAISLSWSVDPDQGLLLLAPLTAYLIFAFLILQTATLRFATTLLSIIVLTGALNALIAIGQYFGINPLGYWQAVKPASSFVNKNFLALYLDIVLPFALILFVQAKHAYSKWLWSLCAALIFSFLILSRTRGSWLGLIAATLALILLIYKQPSVRVWLGQKIRKNTWYIVLITLTPLVFLSLPGSVLPSGYKTAALMAGHLDNSIETRLNAYADASQMIIDNPLLGTGFGGFRMGFRPYMFSRAPMFAVTEDQQLGRLHSDPLQQFVELGIPGGILSLIIYLWALWLAWRLISEAESHLFPLGLGLFLALIASGAHALVDFPLHKPNSAVLWVVILSLIVALYRDARNSARIPLRTSVIALIGFLGVVFIFAAGSLYFPYIKANMDMKSAIRANASGQCELARNHIDAAWRRFKLDFQEREQYVRVYAFCDFPLSDKLQAMDEVLNYDANNTRALLTRGQIYLMLGQPLKSVDDFARVTALLPHRASGYLGLGHVARSLHDYERARKYYQLAVDAEPHNPLARKFLKLAEQEIGHKTNSNTVQH